MFISDHHVTAPVMAGFIGEATLQHQRHLGALMGVLRQFAASANAIQHGAGVIVSLQAKLLHARQKCAERQGFYR